MACGTCGTSSNGCTYKVDVEQVPSLCTKTCTAEKTIKKAHVVCTHFSTFSIKLTVRVVTFLVKSY